MSKGFKEFLRMMKDECCSEEVISTHKMTDEQKVLFEAFMTLGEKRDAIQEEMKTAKRKFWNKVEHDLQQFNEMQINRETMEIEILGEKKEDK